MKADPVHLADIRIYPVKALKGASLADAIVEPWGLAGDRRWMVVDDTARFITQRTHARMALIEAAATDGGLRLTTPGQRPLDIPFPAENAGTIEVTVWRDTLPARLASMEADRLLGEAIGAPCRLVWMHDTRARPTDPVHAPAGSTVNFADGFPLLLGTTASLDALNTWLPSPVTIGRFRPNLVVEGASAWDEDRWRRIRIGEIVFFVAKACDRCIVTTIDPERGERPDKTEPLRTLGRYRKDEGGGVIFGQNLVPETTGALRVGDPVEILERGEPNVRIAEAAMA